jgi:glycosyltransferase involved in cell wall biosynthesis
MNQSNEFAIAQFDDAAQPRPDKYPLRATPSQSSNLDQNYRPLVSVGLPVFNGERFLAQTINSILGQTLKDLELIISDNASTDATADICHQFASEDKRIRYFRQSRNRGAAYNWNFVVAQSRGKYFKWASAHDYLHETFLDRCVEVLRSNADVVLCFSRTSLVTDGDEFIEYDTNDLPFLQDKASERFLALMTKSGTANECSGLIRLPCLKRTRLDRAYPHGDKVLMAELAIHGTFWMIDESLFHRRTCDTSSVTRHTSHKELQLVLNPERKAFRSLDLCIQQLDFLRSSITAPIPLREKPALVLGVLRRIAWKREYIFRELLSTLRRSA